MTAWMEVAAWVAALGLPLAVADALTGTAWWQ